MVTPMTVWPCSTSSAAARDESTPPLIATSTFMGGYTPGATRGSFYRGVRGERRDDVCFFNNRSVLCAVRDLRGKTIPFTHRHGAARRRERMRQLHNRF